MSVRIASSVTLHNCPQCKADFAALYDAVDMAMSFGKLQTQLSHYGVSYTGAGFNRLSVSLKCSALARAVLRWHANSAIIESWTC